MAQVYGYNSFSLCILINANQVLFFLGFRRIPVLRHILDFWGENTDKLLLQDLW